MPSHARAWPEACCGIGRCNASAQVKLATAAEYRLEGAETARSEWGCHHHCWRAFTYGRRSESRACVH